MKKLTLLVVLAILFSAAPVFAHCGMCGMGEAKGSDKGSMSENWTAEKTASLTEALGLSEEQAAQVTAALEVKKSKKNALKEEKKANMDAIRDEFHAALKSILTAEQLEKHEAMMAEKEKMKAEMKGGDHHHGEHKGSGHDEHEGSN